MFFWFLSSPTYFIFLPYLGVVVMGLFLNQNIDTDKKQDGVQKAMGDYVYKFWHLLGRNPKRHPVYFNRSWRLFPSFKTLMPPIYSSSFWSFCWWYVSRGIGVFVPISKFFPYRMTFEKNTALIITWGGLRGVDSVSP